MMTQMLTATLSSKAQITLPKGVRKLLGLKQRGDLVGFLLDAELHTVKLTRVEALPVDEEFTEEEYIKLAALRREKGKKVFQSAREMIKELKR